ncbi:MAG: hypothetical protein R6U96_18540 [Promethearchaeia archaeon]
MTEITEGYQSNYELPPLICLLIFLQEQLTPNLPFQLGIISFKAP